MEEDNKEEEVSRLDEVQKGSIVRPIEFIKGESADLKKYDALDFRTYSRINRAPREGLDDETLVPIYVVTPVGKHGSKKYGIRAEPSKIQIKWGRGTDHRVPEITRSAGFSDSSDRMPRKSRPDYRGLPALPA